MSVASASIRSPVGSMTVTEAVRRVCWVSSSVTIGLLVGEVQRPGIRRRVGQRGPYLGLGHHELVVLLDGSTKAVEDGCIRPAVR